MHFQNFFQLQKHYWNIASQQNKKSICQIKLRFQKLIAYLQNLEVEKCLERRLHTILYWSCLLSCSVPFALFNYDTIMANTRTIYFSCYPFAYNIQVKTRTKICSKKCILGLDSNAAFAAKWLKLYIILLLFFTAEWPPCQITKNAFFKIHILPVGMIWSLVPQWRTKYV